MSEFDKQSILSWREYLAQATPTMLLLEADEIYQQYQNGELYRDFAKDLLGDIDTELRKHNCWLPKRLQV